MVFAWIFDVGSSFTHRCLCVIFRSLRLFCPSGRLITFLRNLSSCTPIDGSLDDQKSCLKSTERWRCRRRIFPPNAAPCMSFIFKKWRHLEKWSRLSDAIDRVLECAVNGNEHLHVTRRELLSGKHFLAQLQEQEVWIKERALHKCLCAPQRHWCIDLLSGTKRLRWKRRSAPSDPDMQISEIWNLSSDALTWNKAKVKTTTAFNLRRAVCWCTTWCYDIKINLEASHDVTEKMNNFRKLRGSRPVISFWSIHKWSVTCGMTITFGRLHRWINLWRRNLKEINQNASSDSI